MPHVIAEPCIGLKNTSCVEVCPVACIHTHPNADQCFINPDACIDCGLCVDVCPVQAIFPAAELPEEWRHFAQVNASLGRETEALAPKAP